MSRRFSTRRLIVGAGLLLLAALILPFIHFNRYRGRVAAALTSGLGRHVEIGSVGLRLLPMPAVVVENVAIGEDPAFGAEAFVRMSELRGNFRLSSLWTGRLAFSSLVFVEPSVNLAHRAGAQPAWNLEALFSGQSAIRVPVAAAAGSRSGSFPYIEVQGGRINFKEGDLKSVFFFSDVDAAFFQEDGKLHVRFKGAPSRTDRNLTGAGEVRVEGEFGPQLASPVSLQVLLTNAFLSDFLALFRGTEPGIQGTLGLNMQVTGRLSTLRVQGRLQVSRLYSGGAPPPSSSSPLDVEFAGLADIPSRRVEVTDLRTEQGRVTAFGRLQNFPENPAWNLEVRLDDADAGRLFNAVRYFSARLSRDLQVSGRLQGALRLNGMNGEGEVVVKDFSLSAPDVQPLRAAQAVLRVEGSILRLLPVSLPLEDGPPLKLGLACDWTAPMEGGSYVEASAEGRNLKMSTLAPLAAALGWPGLPAEGRASLSGRVEIQRDSPPIFSGWITASLWRWTPQWLGQPLVVHNARLEFSPRQIKVKGLVASAGDSMITGTVDRHLGTDTPWVAELRVDQTSTGKLGGLLLIPEAVAPVKPPEIRARISIGRLHIRAAALDDVRASVVWANRRLQLQDVRAALGGGQIQGSAQVVLVRPTPQFKSKFQLAAVPVEALGFHKATGWISGKVEIEGQGKTAAEIDDSLLLNGSFTGRDMVVEDPALAESLKLERVASLAADVVVLGRRVRFTRLILRGEGGDLEATGAVGFDRRLDLDFRGFRLAGTLDQPRRLTPAEVVGMRLP